MLHILAIAFVAGIMFIGGIGLTTLNGCSPAEFQKDHPVAAEVIEEVVELGEDVAEGYAEHQLELPHGSLRPVFKHRLFPELPQPNVPVSPFKAPPVVNAPVEGDLR